METEHKIMSIRIIASAVLLGLSYIPSFTVEIHIALCIAAYLLIGADIVYKAVRNLRYGRIFDENFLMTIATVGAFIIGEYPEAVAVMMFYQIGELFSDIAVARSKASISALIDIRPDYANIETDGILCKVSPEDVPAGSIIVIKPGEKVPLDGTILSGNSTLDTAALTGESLPREVSKGDAIISGSMNLTGLLRIRTSGTYGESTVAKILDLVQNADTGKAQVPPMIIGGEWILWLNRALIFLVISCPCALVVSIPLTFFAGIGGASRKGILVKGSNYLEMLARIRMVALDKTGTLTRGDFSVTAVHPEMLSEQELIELAALAESYSDHPVSASLRNACAKPLDKARVSNVENIAGEGISATVDNRMVYAGNEKLMQRAGVTSKPCEKSGTIVHIAVDGVYMGHIVVSDSIKPQSADAIARMKAGGVKKTVMLTGDHRCVAAEVAQIVNIEEFHAELLPTDKVKIVEELRKEHPEYTIAFIGDGINDAPVLKLADVGIAMGLAGSDAAMEASDVILMNDNLMAVADGMSVARNTLKIVMQNIFFAIGVKFIMLLLGDLGVANMWEAVFADVGVTVLAILNAMRAMHVKTK